MNINLKILNIILILFSINIKNMKIFYNKISKFFFRFFQYKFHKLKIKYLKVL